MARFAIGLTKPGSQFYQIWPHLEGGCRIEEGKQYYLELQDVDSPNEARLFWEEAELTALRSPARRTARWMWEPGFYAGEVLFTLQQGAESPFKITAVTDPDQRKMSRHGFDQMVRDILEDTHALFALSSHRTRIASASGAESPPVARIEYLSSRVEEIEQVVRQINARPARYLRSKPLEIRPDQMRSVKPLEVIKAFSRGKLTKDEKARLPRVFKGYFPRKIMTTGKRSDLDIKEHQEIKAALRFWAIWLSMIADRLEFDTKLKKSAVWAARCRKLSVRLKRLLQLPLFASVGDVNAAPALSSIYRRLPAYRAFFRLYHEFRLGLSNITGEYLNLPLARTHELYELWCFFRIARAAAELYEDVSVDKLLMYNRSTGSVTVPTGVLRITAGKLDICFQLEYKEYWISKGKPGSFSRPMRPDVSITASDRPLIVLDAKYRIKPALNDALSSIHMYRDAIVHADGKERAVAGAYLISPHIGSGEGDWQDARMPDRLFHPVYRGEFKFGALSMKPGSELSAVTELLKSVIDDSLRKSL